MDPGYAQLYSSLQVYQNVYSKLVYVDDKGGFQPGLARSWKQDGDKTWIFDLVDNAVFHNGEPIDVEGRRVHLQPAARRRQQVPHARLLHAGRGRGGHRAPPGEVPPEQALRLVPGQPVPGERDRQREGDQGEGPQALPRRHRAVQVRGVGEGRPHHARALGQVLQAGQALPGQGCLLRAGRRHGAADRASDRPLQLDPDGAAPALGRAGAGGRHQGLGRAALLPLLLLAERLASRRSTTSGSGRPSPGRSTAPRS